MNVKWKTLPNNRLRIGLDCDDVLFECVSIAIALANKERAKQNKPPLKFEDVTGYGVTGNETDEILQYFSKASFFELQTAIAGARELIQRLIAMGHEVFVITSIPPEFALIRRRMLLEAFPELPPENIFCAQRKDLFTVDVMLDDAAHNLVGRRKISAKYPVLLRKPWNRSVSGIRSVENYDEFIRLVESLSASSPRKTIDTTGHKAICLVGPSGSGKTELISEVIKNPFFGRLRPVTTNPNASNTYEIVSNDTFDTMIRDGSMIEHSVYNGHCYGIRTSAIERLWAEGKHVITSIDAVGAYSLKEVYGENNIIVIYCKRELTEVIRSIIERNIPAEDKVAKITELNTELENEETADMVLYQNSAAENARFIYDLIA